MNGFLPFVPQQPLSQKRCPSRNAMRSFEFFRFLNQVVVNEFTLTAEPDLKEQVSDVDNGEFL